MIDYQISKGMILALDAFRGHDLEEYYYLVEPLTEFVSRDRDSDLEALNKLVIAILGARPETTKTTQAEPSVTVQFLADQIKPWIEDIRQTLFHSKSAPFSRIKDAEIWWNKANKRTDEWVKRSREWGKRVNECEACWQAELEKYPLMRNRLFFKDEIPTWRAWRAFCKEGIPVDVLPQEELPQLDEINRYVESLEAGEPPEQDKQSRAYIVLLHDIIDIVKVTGFTMESVKMCILADASPVLPPFTFGIHRETHSLPSGISLLNRFARVTIRGELTFDDLRSLYRGIRRELGIKRSKRPTTKHSQLYEMVQQKGAIPSGKGTVAFWRSVMKEWNDLHKQDKYNRWQDVKGAYERIIARFERRIITKEAQKNERTRRKEG